MTVLYTDGACSGTPGPGGWAWIADDGRQGYGNDPSTTNQRMEMLAVLEALRATEGTVIVVSDSAYVVNCFAEKWWKTWLLKDWRKSSGGPVANRDLWEPLIQEVLPRKVIFKHVRGHNGDVMNERVDKLAVVAKKQIMTFRYEQGACPKSHNALDACPWCGRIPQEVVAASA